jgi:hypothetical protein
MSTWFRTYGFAEVHPGLLVGAYPLDRGDVGELEALRVVRVLNLAQDPEYPPGRRATVEAAYAELGIEERRLDLVDFGALPPERIERGVATLVAWLRDGHTAYAHCRAGWQRSAALAAGAVAVLEQRPIDEALAIVHQRKPTADPLAHQVDDLLTWWSGRAEAAARRRGDGPLGIRPR